MEFRVEMLHMFKELKETVECTANKTQEDVAAKMRRKKRTEMSELKNLQGKLKNSLEALSSKTLAAED